MNYLSKLYLIPNSLGSNENLSTILPEYNFTIVTSLKHFFVEDLRNARRFIKSIDKNADIESLTFFEINKHTTEKELNSYIMPLSEGNDFGIISEAGLPCVADPGSKIVELAHQLNIEVIPLVGPSSILLALMGSGFNGQQFTFHGYLPINKDDRAQKLKQLEAHSKRDETQLFMDAPYRNMQLLETICATLSPKTRLAIAVDLTLPTQQIKVASVGEWKKNNINFHKRPAIFCLSN